MPDAPRLPLLPLALFAAAFGLEECTVVVYLRHLAFPHGYPAAADGLMAHVASLEVYRLEIAREASTIVTLAVLAWLSGRSARLRWRAFLYAFGLWDIVYYAGLWAITGYPTPLQNDVLFLIPVPWVAPVWAALAFAASFVALGVLGFDSGRAWLFAGGLLMGFASFVAANVDGGVGYPLWLFVPAIALVLAALPVQGGARSA
ncbi:MAG TPA: hypothetical protein VNJ51_07405 [Candidatus Dormibacteraeota bacterium]|nr:hypothetical protein [Candidatus Dormibacteraeota bacterium]